MLIIKTMKTRSLITLALSVSLLLGCETEQPTSKVVYSVKITTIGLGPRSHRKEIVKKLKDAGVPVTEGEERERGIASVMWPKSYDKIANSIINRPQEPTVPLTGAILSAGTCKETGKTYQSWQTISNIWLISFNSGMPEAIKLPANEQPNKLKKLNVLITEQSKCNTLEDNYYFLIADPNNHDEIEKTLSMLDKPGSIVNSNNGYYYWVKK